MTEEEIIEQWEPKIQGLARREWIEGLDTDDILQELRQKTIETWRRFNPDFGIQFHTFLHVALENHLKILYRKTQAKRRICVKISLEFAYNVSTKDEYNIIDGLGDLKSLGLTQQEIEACDMIIQGYPLYQIPDWQMIKQSLQKKMKSLMM